MLTLPRESPNFDLAMECLALLPRWPNGVFLDCLCQDLGLRKQRDVRQLFDELDTKHRIRVNVYREDLGAMPPGQHVGFRAAVEQRDWLRAKEQAEKYLAGL